jgi:myosin-5
VRFVERTEEGLIFSTDEQERYTLPLDTVLTAALPSSLSGVSDLLQLEELHEGAILHTLRARYAADSIYTSLSSILISINPYRQLPCYGPTEIERYRRVLAKRRHAEPQSGAPTEAETVPPHVYALADDAYASLIRDGRDQAIIISGESGAGEYTRAVERCTRVWWSFESAVG